MGCGRKQNNQNPNGEIFKGTTFVVTGTLDNFSRNEIKDFIEKNGGKVSSSVSKKTDYVLVGENPGSKADNARSLGVKIITEDELIKLAGIK